MDLSSRGANEKSTFKLEGMMNSKTNFDSKYEDLKKHYEEEMKKLENSYREVQKNQEIEHEKFIQEIDKVLVEKENEIDESKNEISDLKSQLKKMKNIFSDSEREKDDLQKTILQMGTENEEINRNYEQLVMRLLIIRQRN